MKTVLVACVLYAIFCYFASLGVKTAFGSTAQIIAIVPLTLGGLVIGAYAGLRAAR